LYGGGDGADIARTSFRLCFLFHLIFS